MLVGFNKTLKQTNYLTGCRKMNKTNFDNSSTGLNITVSACYDLELSRFYFEETFFTIKEGNKDFLVYCEGNFSDFEKEYTFTKDAIIREYVMCHDNRSYDLASFKRSFVDCMGFSYHMATKADIIEFIKADLYDNENWFDFCGKSCFKSNFDIVVSRGYSQGDYKEVIVPYKFWEVIGQPKPLDVQSNLGKYIDNLLWDCPIYCRFAVNEEEFFIDESLKNSYTWDKAEALEIAAKLIKDSFTSEEQAIIIDFLASALKTDLDYL